MELELLQARFAKYEDLLWKVRSFAVALVSALVGWGISDGSSSALVPPMFTMASAIAAVFYFQEGLIRFVHVYKYTVRYRRLREVLNDPSGELEDLPVFDLTNHIEGRGRWWPRCVFAFLRVEALLFYGILGATPVILWCILR